MSQPPRGRPLPLVALLLAAGALLPPPARAQEYDPAALKSADVRDRLAAVRQAANNGGEGAEAFLLLATADRDWEVVQAACAGLARRGTPKASLRPLAELAVNGDIRRIRLTAAAALGAIAPEEGAKMLIPALRAKDMVPALAAEALAEIRHASSLEGLRAAIRNKEGVVRREAAAATGATRDPSVLKELETLFEDPDIGARAGAVEGMARTGSLEALPVLVSLLQSKDLLDLVERRAAAAIRRILWTHRENEDVDRAVQRIVGAYRNEKDSIASARLARVLGSVARGLPLPPPAETPEPGAPGEAAGAAPPPPAAAPQNPNASVVTLQEGAGPIGDASRVVAALAEVGLTHAGVEARRAAAAALGRAGGDAALEHLARTCIADKTPSVRFHALRGYSRWKTARADDAFALFAKVLRYDESPVVREEAAVRLGVPKVPGAAEVLAAAVEKDTAWEVACSAAVSLGKTRDEKGLPALVAALGHKDWRNRGAAAAGLGWLKSAKAIPHLVVAVGDAEPCVSRTAWEFLKRLAGKDLPLRRKSWEDWWAAEEATFEIIDREKEIRDAKKYGYALRDRDVYEDLDVVVLQSRGDSIENLLTTLEVNHRMTRAKGVVETGLQPFGVFVANCTGEVQKEDHDRIQWFVHVGGALFGSCWAINETIGKEFPDTIRKYPKAKGQVLDKVRAEEMPTETTYLDGVFPDVSRPMYELYGAYLIEVLDPERCEVLMDSPDCATRWNGGGNLAAWFTSGHGVVMGSSNHFDRQTLSKLKDAKNVSIKTEEDRMAFSADHFGFSYERIRDLRERGVYAKQAEAEREVTDQSAFRFLTNFVRRKRQIEE